MSMCENCPQMRRCKLYMCENYQLSMCENSSKERERNQLSMCEICLRMKLCENSSEEHVCKLSSDETANSRVEHV